MHWLEAALLGLLQALTEYLPVSSSGHLEVGKRLLAVQGANNPTFSVVVHLGTAISTVVVFRHDIATILRGLWARPVNPQQYFAGLIVLSMIPASVVGLLLKDRLDAFFEGDLLLVGSGFLFTAVLLGINYFVPYGERPIGPRAAWWIGVMQAVAILPGISRSGATISTALLLGVERQQAARFSFLMAVPLIVAAAAKDGLDLLSNPAAAPSIGWDALLVGFAVALVAGIAACRLMLELVRRTRLWGFAVYCGLLGFTCLAVHFWG